METYVSRRQNTVAKYIATSPIMDLCLAVKQMQGPRVAIWWWEHDDIDLEGMRMTAQTTERTEGEEETDGTETATDG